MSARPTAAELVAAVADFLDQDVRTVGGQVGFHARVATNVLRIVERDLLDDTPAAVRDALDGLGCSDEDALAQGIREGRLDDRLRPEAQPFPSPAEDPGPHVVAAAAGVSVSTGPRSTTAPRTPRARAAP